LTDHRDVDSPDTRVVESLGELAVNNLDPTDVNDEVTASQLGSLTLQMVRGVVPAFPGRVTTDLEDQIEEAMEEEAQRIVDGN
jgi:hypothetical protein